MMKTKKIKKIMRIKMMRKKKKITLKKIKINMGGMASLLPVESLRLAVGEYALGPLHVERPDTLGGTAHGL